MSYFWSIAKMIEAKRFENFEQIDWTHETSCVWNAQLWDTSFSICLRSSWLSCLNLPWRGERNIIIWQSSIIIRKWRILNSCAIPLRVNLHEKWKSFNWRLCSRWCWSSMDARIKELLILFNQIALLESITLQAYINCLQRCSDWKWNGPNMLSSYCWSHWQHNS